MLISNLFKSLNLKSIKSLYIPGRNLSYIRRKPLRRTSLETFCKITPTRWCGNGCPHVRPHPGLTNLEFGRVNLYFRLDTFGLFSVDNPWV